MKIVRFAIMPVVLSLLVVLAGSPARLSAEAPRADLPPGDDAKVNRVVSGDTIEVRISDIGFTIGYLGVDAPDPASAKSKAQCYGAQALAFNSQLVKGKTLRVEREVSDFDPAGRLLRWVFLPDGRLVNEEIVAAGYALAVNVSPDSKYRERLAAAQQAAQSAKRGLWGSCPGMATVTPSTAVTPDAPAANALNPACPSPDVCILAPASGTSVYPGTVVVFIGTATHAAFTSSWQGMAQPGATSPISRRRW